MVYALRIFLFLLVVVIPPTHATTTPIADSDDPYEVLGVSPDVDDDTITDVWRRLIKTLHPDAGGADEEAQIVIEAYQFLKRHRVNYDQGLMPFRGHFREGRAEAILLPPEQETRYQALLRRYLSFRTRALDLADLRIGHRGVFLLYAMLNLSGDRGGYMEFKPYQLRAYRALVGELGLLQRLTRSELAAIILRDPVEALERTLEHYDNFNVRLPIVQSLFYAYDLFYSSSPQKSLDFLALIERMKNNRMLFDPRGRFDRIRDMAVISLKTWLGNYLRTPRASRRDFHEQYKRTRRLVLSLEGFPASLDTCGRLLIGVPPRLR